MATGSSACCGPVVIEDDRVPYYEGILEHLPEDMRVFNEEDYLQDCQDRAASACSSFQYTNTGFTRPS